MSCLSVLLFLVQKPLMLIFKLSRIFWLPQEYPDTMHILRKVIFIVVVVVVVYIMHANNSMKLFEAQKKN